MPSVTSRVIGTVGTASPLLERAGLEEDAGIVSVEGTRGVGAFIAAAKNGRIWDREPTLRSPA